MKRKEKKIGGQRILWLKFLVLISFLSFAGFFDNPALDTKAHDHFRHETRDKYQSWKESKIGPTPTSENKMKNWGSMRPPSPTTRASIRWYLKVINLGRKPKTIPSSPSTNTPALSLTKLSTLWYKHLLIQLNKFTVQSFFLYNTILNTTIILYSCFSPSDLPRRTHLVQTDFLSLCKDCLRCGSNIYFKRMRFV